MAIFQKGVVIKYPHPAYLNFSESADNRKI
jgi:hypothetical protein